MSNEVKAPPTPKAAAPSTVMLNWKQARVAVIHPSHQGSQLFNLSDPDAKLTAEQVKAELAKNKPLTILPGIHVYPREVWETAKLHPNIVNLLRDEQLVVITNALVSKGDKTNALEPAASMPASLVDVPSAQAVDLVEGTLDQELLAKWTKAEMEGPKRHSVVQSLKDQTELLKATDARFKGENGN